jgi:hypothetical protein
VNAYDILLQWASERGQGSWQNWRDACAALAIDGPSQAARRLSALGHVEFDWVENRFACAPPTATLTLHASGCLLLTGARPRGLRVELERLVEADDTLDVDLREPVEQEGGPATWLVEAEMDELERFCALAGLELHVHAGRRLLEALPQASLADCGEPGRPSGRFPRFWFQPTPPFWLKPERPDGGEDGLWWIEEYRRKVAFVCQGGDWFRIPVREYGPYLAYPEVAFARYDDAAEVLEVDDQAPLPPLLARALTLQSGRLPKKTRAGRHGYVNIDAELAALVRAKLGRGVKL